MRAESAGQAAVRAALERCARARGTLGASLAQRCRARLERWAQHTGPEKAREAWEEGLGDVRHPVGWTLAERIGYAWRSAMVRDAQRHTLGDAALAQWGRGLAEQGARALAKEVEAALGTQAQAAQEAVDTIAARALEHPESARAATQAFKISVRGLARLAQASERLGDGVLERWWLIERLLAGENPNEDESLARWAGRLAWREAERAGMRALSTPNGAVGARAGARALEWPFGAKPPLVEIWAEAAERAPAPSDPDAAWGGALLQEGRAGGRTERAHGRRVRASAQRVRALIGRCVERTARAAAREWEPAHAPEATLARLARAWREGHVENAQAEPERHRQAVLGEEAGVVVWTLERTDVRAVLAEARTVRGSARRSCTNVPVALDARTLTALVRAPGVEQHSKRRERRLARALLESRR